MRFILASSSPARRETLMRAGITPEIIVSGLDESSIAQDSNTPAEYAQLLANSKAQRVVAEIRGEALVLGCDSLLEFEGAAMGKPGTIAAAMERWRRMRGKRGVLHTGHCLMDVAAERVCIATVSTAVHFADLSDEEIEAYCSSGEPSNVAGGFTIDGYGGWFIDGIEGDPHNVVGVSLPVLRRMMGELNVRLTDIGYPAF